MSEWSHLSNAQHIDQVIESVTSHSDIWDAAWDARRTYWRAAWNVAWRAAADASRHEALMASTIAARALTARGTILALIAYDDAAKYLNMPSEQLKVWAALSEDPAATLLISAVTAYEKISELKLKNE